MKVSEFWLREWVDTQVNSQQLANLLTMAGLEVDAISSVAGPFSGVIIAQVVTTRSHPEADKLTLCEINVGSDELLRVVCGASNVRPGLKVALAMVKAVLPGDIVIKETRLRGELSQGMLCSASELRLLEQTEGILELDENAPIGMDLREYLALDDQVLDIDLTPNRADCLSIVGVAREVAALTGSVLRPLPDITIKPSMDEQKQVIIQAQEACPHYCGRIIRGINPSALTPQWMRERLRRSGIRAIHPVVDVTNYVMLELGQPMHAFDLSAIHHDVVVRFARNKEKISLLDDQSVSLDESILVISDGDEKALAIAGVMGGKDSQVTELSTAIFLESAYFNPRSIAGVARRFGLFTDSAQRYERGVDSTLQQKALDRATSLLIDIVGGDAGPVSSVKLPAYLPTHHPILFAPSKVKQLTGLLISEARMAEILKDLGMQLEQQEGLWKVVSPSYRFDINLDVDLIEEIIRIQGYDTIPGEPMISTVMAGRINPIETLEQHVNHFFTARGYHETISYSFVDPALQSALYPDKESLSLLNPISSELSHMRTGIWPGLMASMIYNMHRQQTAIKCFETGSVFELNGQQLVEHPSVGGLLKGEIGALSWNEPTRPYDFYDAKGDLHALFTSLRLVNIHFSAGIHPALHPGKSAQIIHEGELVGWCGVLHPRLSDALDLQGDVVVFEVKLNALLSKTIPHYQSISKFPQIRRDLSLLVDETIDMACIDLAIREVNSPWLKALHVFDVYMGESIPEGKKSLAISLALQDNTRTLTDDEINNVISAIIKTLKNKFAITLRD